VRVVESVGPALGQRRHRGCLALGSLSLRSATKTLACRAQSRTSGQCSASRLTVLPMFIGLRYTSNQRVDGVRRHMPGRVFVMFTAVVWFGLEVPLACGMPIQGGRALAVANDRAAV
jgi:hypothetical protein